MKRILLSATVLAMPLLAAQAILLARDASGAEDPKTDLMKVMPPEKPHPSGTLLFAIFPREGKDWDEMTATAWEFVPDRVEQPLVKRCVFLKSHWSASPLTGRSVVEPLGCDLVRLQVNDGPRPYSVRLYHIDYANWKVRTLFSGKQALGIGRAGDRAYLRTSEGLKVLDIPSGKLAGSDPRRNEDRCSDQSHGYGRHARRTAGRERS